MSELSDQIEAHKARQQRFEVAGMRYVDRCAVEADIRQAEILERYVPGPETLPPIPNLAMAVALQIAFPPPPRLIMNRVQAIQHATLTEFPTITMADLRSQRRTAAIVRARQVAMYIAKKMTSQSLPEIGNRFGGRDHTTVFHAVKKIGALVEKDPELAAKIERIKENIPEVGIW